MKTSICLVCLPALGLLFAGCGEQKSAPADSTAPAKAAAGGKQSAASIRPTSFKAVTSQLDAGGTLYGYVSLDQWLGGLSGKVSEVREFVLSLPDIPQSDRQMIIQSFDLARSLVKASGIESLDGVGLSAIQVAPGLFRTKTILHHPEGAGDGVFWTLFGKREHELAGLKLLPANTAVAAFGDLDVAGLWTLIKQELSQSGIAPVVEGVKVWPAKFEEMTQLKWTDVLASLGGEQGLIITMDEARTVQIPAGAGPVEIPEPALMIAVRTKNELLYDRILEALKDNPSVATTAEAGLKMAAMPLPLPIPIPVQVVVASSGDYLFVSTSTNLVRSALAVRKGESSGIKDSPEFKALAQHVKLSGNQFSYTDKRLSQAVNDVQKKIMSAQGIPKGQMDFMGKMFLDQPPSFGLAVSSHTGTGWNTVTVGNQDVSMVALAVPVAVVAVAAGVTLPALAKAKVKAQTISSVSNVKQIALAARMYSNDHDDKYPPAEAWCDALMKDYQLPEKIFKAQGDTSPERSSYAYNSRVAGMDEGKINPQTVVFFECAGGWNKHGGKEFLAPRPHHADVYVFGFADGSVRQVRVADLHTLRWDP